MAVNHPRTGLSIIAGYSNEIYGTTENASRFESNRVGVAVTGGSRTNTIGPNVRIASSGGQSGAGVTIDGAATDRNIFIGLEIVDTDGPAVRLGQWASQNTITDSKLLDSVGPAISMSQCPDTTVSNCRIRGRAGTSSALISVFNWCPRTIITDNVITSASAINGIYLDNAPDTRITRNIIAGSFPSSRAGSCCSTNAMASG